MCPGTAVTTGSLSAPCRYADVRWRHALQKGGIRSAGDAPATLFLRPATNCASVSASSIHLRHRFCRFVFAVSSERSCLRRWSSWEEESEREEEEKRTRKGGSSGQQARWTDPYSKRSKGKKKSVASQAAATVLAAQLLLLTSGDSRDVRR